MIAAADDHTAHQPEYEDAEQHAHQADIQTHVAVKYVTEFVRHDALQFITIEEFERASRDGDRGIARRVAGCEGVDAAFLFQHVYFRDRDARGDRHLLDDVAQAPPQRVRNVCGDQRATHLPRDLSSAGRKHHGLVDACTENEQRGYGRRDEQWHGVGCQHFTRRITVAVHGAAEECEADHQRYADHDQRGGDEVNYDKPARGLACPVLRVKKIQCLAAGCQVKETSGTSRFSSDSISRKLASSKRNIPAMMLLGKFSAVLL